MTLVVIIGPSLARIASKTLSIISVYEKMFHHEHEQSMPLPHVARCP